MSSYARIPYATPSATATFPYSKEDLTPSDPSSDLHFYSSPRFVTHIDVGAISLLSKYFGENLPRKGRILDICSSWISHYPAELAQAEATGQLEIVGLGMNSEELAANPLFKGRWGVKDLNVDPSINGWNGDKTEEKIDSTTCTVSVDYLTQPLPVLTSLRERTTIGGTVHLAISNRCFPTKVVSRWLGIYDEQRLKMVADYLWFSGWRNIEILTLSDGISVDPPNTGVIETLKNKLGWRRCDPLWVVRGENQG